MNTYTTAEELVERYAQAAAEYGAAMDRSDVASTNRQHDRIAVIYRELRSRGREAQLHLLRLLDDTNIAVRGWAATHALEFASEKAVPVLEAMMTMEGKGVGMWPLMAEMALSEWRNGKLRFT